MGQVMTSDDAAPILLLSMPQMSDPNFARTVVLLCDYTEQGAFGLVVNRQMSEPAWTLIQTDPPIRVNPELRLFVGGPVVPDGVIVLAEWEDPELAVVLVEHDLGFVPGDVSDSEAVAAAVRRARVYAGHAGWGPGQLEAELEEEAWIVEAPLRDELFTADPDGLWAAVLRR